MRIAPHSPQPVAKAARRFLSAQARQMAWEASDGLCGLCGEPVALFEAEWDHRVSLVAGGSNDLANFQPVHPACHRRKSKVDVRIGAKIRRILARMTGERRARRPILGRGFDTRLSRGFDGKVRER